ncbi:LacI family DNA-binding transcriptional regulator [Actinoallomurus soli]|uniref:LacI family DNA-binding transcriptional regulator n=1 Tax=Actinoallomurus soli TaxID=2952535 RepID=UPI0020921694|nr:LacI family DNA-binding transcriptional regulator [Actinoallomurus soli]MCO5973508.1 LacI family transcriptional regulator [Actinoallomurus soli]
MTSTSPQRGRRSASMKDVAARAGVSVKTVSNVINGAAVGAGTRERVQRAIADLGYRPNISARNLRRGRTGILALAVPELDQPYFAELARLIVDAAEEHGYTIIIDQTGGGDRREQYVIDGMGAKLADGVIFSPVAMDRLDIARRVDTTPLVLLGERVSAGPADHVAIDNVAAARTATAHLAGLGRRRIAAIGAQPDHAQGTSRLRETGFRAALEEAGLPVEESLIVPARDYHRRDGAEAAAYLTELEDPPDAVFCFNDTLALGAMRTLHDRGYRIPHDVAVVGFDDIDDGRYNVPSLTTVSPDKAGIARSALRLLLDRIEAIDSPPREVTVRHELRVRESSGMTTRRPYSG